MKSHKAAYDAWVVECLVIFVVIIYPVTSIYTPGKPDIVLPKYKTAIFINGCFWHGHEGCRHFIIPKTNTDYWMSKIRNNQHRDKESVLKLQQAGWKVLTIWECELTTTKFLETIRKIETIINADFYT